MTISAENLVVRDTVKEKVHTTVNHIHGYIDEAEVKDQTYGICTYKVYIFIKIFS